MFLFMQWFPALLHSDVPTVTGIDTVQYHLTIKR